MSDLGNKKIFSENLKYYMELNKKDRTKICNDLGFKYTTLREWVKGTAYPRIDKIELLANYFGIQKSDLIEKKDVIILEGKTETLLFNYISKLAKNEVEKELLSKCTILTCENQSKLLDLVDMYLKIQGDYYIKDKDKWIDSFDNKEHYKTEYNEMMKELNEK